MKKHWYDNDWFMCILVCTTIIATIVGNYYIHGGEIQW